MVPPSCTDCSKKDGKITELETKITNLQQSQSLKNSPISEGIKQEVINISKDLVLPKEYLTKIKTPLLPTNY